MEQVKILVVEDEMIIAQNLCMALEQLNYLPLEPAISFGEALDRIEKESPDLVILDIQLSGKKDGIDLAWTIREEYHIPFIFLTSNSDKMTIDRAKQVAPPAFLLKPFSKEDLYASIEIALFNYSRTRIDEQNLVIKDALFMKVNQRYIKVRFADICFIKSDHVYLEIHAKEEKFLIRGSLTEFITKLPDHFLRIHRSYVINLEHLDSIDSDSVTVSQEKIPVSKNYRNELLQKVRTT